jgi:carbonic anhydrase
MRSFSIFAATIAVVCATMGSVQAVGSAQASDAIPDDGSKKWSYRTTDTNTFPPAEWGQKAAACGGKRQSPIDIASKQFGGYTFQRNLKVPLVLSGDCSKYKVKQLYDAFKAEAVDSTCQVTANGKPYEYLQAHYHVPAEHTINGKVHDAEIHYVHKADDGLLVIGLFFQKEKDVKTDPFVLQFWQQIKAANANTTVDATLGSFIPSLEAKMKAGRVFNYPGSLTSPTCDETVDWWVVEKPLAVSAADFDAMQLDLLRIQASDNGKAARPTQPLNGRVVTSYFMNSI